MCSISPRITEAEKKIYIYTLIEYDYYWTYKNYSGIKFISINPELLE